MNKNHDIHIIGGGLAGCEAAWQLGRRGLRVRLSEMRGAGDMTPAHQTIGLAELVCSNSFRSDDHEQNAVGLLHEEMRRRNSLIMRSANVTIARGGSPGRDGCSLRATGEKKCARYEQPPTPSGSVVIRKPKLGPPNTMLRLGKTWNE